MTEISKEDIEALGRQLNKLVNISTNQLEIHEGKHDGQHWREDQARKQSFKGNDEWMDMHRELKEGNIEKAREYGANALNHMLMALDSKEKEIENSKMGDGSRRS